MTLVAATASIPAAVVTHATGTAAKSVVAFSHGHEGRENGDQNNQPTHEQNAEQHVIVHRFTPSPCVSDLVRMSSLP